MNKPELYIKANILAQLDADYILNRNLELLNNDTNCAVLDVGCGPGNVTFDKILKVLPPSTRILLGVDISHPHVEYAKKYYQNDSRISYEQLDIITDVVPKEYVDAFDLVLSLHCFQYIGDHQKAFTNIYEMMRLRGELLIAFVGNSLLAEVYCEISNKPKWKKYMSEVSRSVPPINTSSYYETLLAKIGFEQVKCEVVQRCKSYSEQEAFDILNACNVYPVPKSEESEFIQDHVDGLMNKGCLSIKPDGKKHLDYKYDLFIITARKS
ncbi:hypothetical protein FQR65_LT00053 [Abscondita terminalis]|nr:hypothetical protein FQR65_LT00053 [Abscondita terminalis]